MAKGSETLRKGVAVSAGSFASPQLLHASSRTRKAHGFSALAAQTHDLDLPPGCNPMPLGISITWLPLWYLER